MTVERYDLRQVAMQIGLEVLGPSMTEDELGQVVHLTFAVAEQFPDEAEREQVGKMLLDMVQRYAEHRSAAPRPLTR